MIKDADLISYLPPVLQNIRELQVITDSENPEFQLVFDTSEKVLGNLFIHDADEAGIKRYEKILGIKPSSNDTLETRRFRVLSRWNDRMPYTWKALLEKLDTLCGEGNYTIILKNDEYTIDLTTYLGVYGEFNELSNLLEKVIPCNLIVNAENILFGQKETALYFGSAVNCGLHYTLTTNISEDYQVSSDVKMGSKIVDGMHYLLTSNINEDYEVSSDGKMGSKIVDGAVYTLKSAD